jgi:hypothetical protein
LLSYPNQYTSSGLFLSVFLKQDLMVLTLLLWASSNSIWCSCPYFFSRAFMEFDIPPRFQQQSQIPSFVFLQPSSNAHQSFPDLQ